MKKLDRRQIGRSVLVGYLIQHLVLFGWPVYGASRTQVVADGNTRTQLTINGNITDVRTSTINGRNAFNSFSEFDVFQGNTVNLFVPDQSQNLINLVHNKSSEINGVLNAYQNGQIGGNVFFANPYGFVVSASGTVNVGSLSVSTPTHGFIGDFFLGAENPADVSVAHILEGTVPLNAAGLIALRGQINASGDIRLAGGQVLVAGTVTTGYNHLAKTMLADELVQVSDVVSGVDVVESNGDVFIIGAGDVVIDGQIIVDGRGGLDAGAIDVRAGQDVVVSGEAVLSARGHGEDSDAGKIIVFADRNAELADNALINASATGTGDAGNIEFSAKDTVRLSGGSLQASANTGAAGSILIDPENIEVNANLLRGDGSAAAEGVSWDSGSLTLAADNTITVMQDKVISTRDVANAADVNSHLNDDSQGNSGDLILDADAIALQSGAMLLANTKGAGGHDAGDITLYAARIDVAENVSILADVGGGAGAAGDVFISNLLPIDVNAVDPVQFEIAGFSLADILGEGNDLQGLIDTLNLDEKDVSRLLNTDSEVRIIIGSEGGLTTTITGDNINVDAYASDRFGFKKNATALLTLTNADLQGENISILAESDTGLFPDLFDNTADIAGFTVDPNFFVDEFIDSLGLPDSAFYVHTISSATTTISNTTLNAQEKLAVAAQAVNAANPFSTGRIVGLEIVDAETSANVAITNSSILSADTLSLTAEAETETTADANAAKLLLPGAAALSLNMIDAQATVSSDASSNLSANAVKFEANSTTEVETISTAQTASGSSIVAAVAISDVTSKATAIADGVITAATLEVLATVKSGGNSTKADGGSDGKPGLGDKYNNLKNATKGLLLNNVLALFNISGGGIADAFFPKMKSGSINIAGAVAIANTDNQATAEIGGTGIKAVAGKATVKATIEDDVGIHANVIAESGTSGGFTAGGALTVADYKNSADAHIAEDAKLTAEDVVVDGSSTLAYPWDFDYTNIEEVYKVLTGSLTDFLFTGSAFNKNKSAGAGASASINSISYEANAQAYIGEGADVTVTGENGGALNVSATTDTSLVTVSGKNPFSASSSAIGGSVNVISVSGNTVAYIADDAIVNVGSVATPADLNVSANATINTINIAESGGSSDNIGVNGSVAFLSVDQNTQAFIETDANITADSVDILADTYVALWNIAGGFSKSGAAGIGLSVAMNDVDVSTRSYIGHNEEAVGAAPIDSTVTASAVSINANADGVMDAISIAGALVSSSDGEKSGVFAKVKAAKAKAGSLLDQATSTVDAQRTSSSGKSSGSSASGSTASTGGANGTPSSGTTDTSTPKPSFGVAISGAASVNEVAFNTEAKLQQARVIVQELEVQAINEVDIDAGAGSASLTKAKSASARNTAAFAGAFAYNDIANNTTARIMNSFVSGAEDVAVRSISAGEQLSVGIGMAVNASGNSGNSASIAGSVSLSNSNNSTQAKVEGDSSIVGDGATDSSIEVVAYDKTELGVGAGSLFFGGKGGFGAAVSLSEISNTVASSVDSSSITEFNRFSLRTLNAAKIGSGAGMAGGGSGTSSLAGSFVFAEIENQTSASLSDGAVVTVDDGVEILATDSAGDAQLDLLLSTDTATEYDYEGSSTDAPDNGGNSIVAVAGLIQVGKNNVGVSLVKSDISNSVTTSVADSTITAATIDANAMAKAAITGVAIGIGGGTGSLAANGSVVLSTISNENSAVSTNSTLTTDTLAFNVGDKSSIDSLAGNIAASAKVALGAAVAVSDISNSSTARIDGGTVDTSGDVVVGADSDASIQNLAAAGGAAGTVAIGVSVSVNNIHNSTVASMSSVSFAQQANSLTIAARDKSLIQSLAGSVNGAGTAAAGAAVSVNTMGNYVNALLEDVLDLDIANAVDVDATNDSKIDSIAFAGGGAGTAAFNGSSSTNILANTTEAIVRGVVSSTLATEVSANASDDSSIQSLAGSVGGAGTGAVGAAVAVNDLANQVIADINSSDLRATDINSIADTKASIETIAVAGSGAGTFAVNGSVAVNFIANITQAKLTEVDQLEVGESVLVTATDESSIASLGGSISGAGAAAIGAAVTVNDIGNMLLAEVLDSTLNVSDELKVQADSDANIMTLAVAGGGSGTAAVGGSVATNNIANQTHAFVVDTQQSNSTADVTVDASDTSLIESLAGSVQLSGVAAVGASVAVNRIANEIWSFITGDTTDVKGADVKVDAASDTGIRTVAVGASISGTAGVAGSAAINLMDNSVDSHIDGGAVVLANNNVAVRADSSDDIDVLAGTVAVGVSGAGVGATVSVNKIANTTAAYIAGSSTSVSALANASQGLNISNGITDFAFSDAIASQADAAENGEDGDGSSSGSYSKLDLASKLNADTANRGVSVNATSQQNIDSLGATAGVGLYAGLGATANVNIIGGETAAYVDGATINDSGTANAAQNLAVVAEDHTYTNAFVGAIGGGVAGLGAAVDTTVIDRSTKAYIANSSQAEAESQVVVRATATQGANSIAVGGAAGGVALAVSGSVLKFDADTQAYISKSAISARSVTVQAVADNQSAFYDFAAALGAGGGASSGAFGVNIVNNRTSASIEGSDSAPVTMDVDGAVNVTANSSTRNEAKIISFAADAGGLGVAGMGLVNVITSETLASMDNVYAGSLATPLASLNVAASDEIILDGLAGSVGIGLAAGIGAAATINVVKNRVIADINDTTAVVAGDVSVVAESSKQSDNVTATAAAGLALGLGGAALVNLFGAELEGDAAAELDADGDGTLSAANDLAGGSKTELLEGQDESSVSAQEIAELDAKTQSDIKTVATTESIGDSGYRTGAAIGGSSDISSDTVTVTAQDQTSITATVGAIAGGLFGGFGGAFALTEVKSNVSADIREGASISSSAVKLNASAGKIAGTDNVITTDVLAGAAGLVGVGAAVGIADIENTVSANLAGSVSGGSTIQVNASDTGSIVLDAKGAAAGSGAVGVVVATSEKDTDVIAVVGGSNPYTDIDSLAVNAENSGGVTALSTAGAAGLFAAGTGADAQASDVSSVQATTVDFSIFNLGSSAMSLSALSTPDVKAESIGVAVAGGIKIGASFASAESQQTVSAALGAMNQITAGSLSINAMNGPSNAGYSAYAKALGAGGGLLLGLNATESESSSIANVESTIGAGSTVNLDIVSGVLSIMAQNTTKQLADVSGINGGIVAAGFNNAEASSNSTVNAGIGDGVSIIAKSFDVDALGSDYNYATGVSGSGGVVSGAASETRTRSVSATNANVGLGVSNDSITVDYFGVNAEHSTLTDSKVSSTNASALGASGAHADNYVRSAVATNIGKNASVVANAFEINAANATAKNIVSGRNVNSASGGIIDAPAAKSDTRIYQTTEVNLLDNAALIQTGDKDQAGVFTLNTSNNVTGDDYVVMNAGGAVAIAKGVSQIRALQNDSTINVGAGVSLIALEDLKLGTRSSANISTDVGVDAYGLAGAPQGSTASTFKSVNAINVGAGARLEAQQDVYLQAGNGSSTVVKANTDLWNKTAIPINGTPNADALVDTTAKIVIGDGADVAAVRDVYLKATRGTTGLSGKGLAKDVYRELAAAAASAISNAFGGDDVSFDITAGSEINLFDSAVTLLGNALVRVGIKARQELVIDFADDNRILYETTRFVNDVEVGDDEGIQIIGEESFSIAEDIRIRITDLQLLVGAYSVGDDTSGENAIAVLAYQNEIDFLRQKLEDLGYSEGSNGFDGVPQFSELDLKELEADGYRSLRDDAEIDRTAAEMSRDIAATNYMAHDTQIAVLQDERVPLVAARDAIDQDNMPAEYAAANNLVIAKDMDISTETELRNVDFATFETEADNYTSFDMDYQGYVADIQVIEDNIALDNVYGTDVPDGPTVRKLIIGNTNALLGNINITAERLNGEGELRAPGDALISITNNTNNFLEVNDLIIPANDGGHIYFNNVDVKSNADVIAANAGVTFDEIINGKLPVGVAVALNLKTAVNSAEPTIKITSTYSPLDPDNENFEVQQRLANIPYANVGPDVIVAAGSGDDLTSISNLRGLVKIDSEAGNIRVERDSRISAKTVEIETRSGDFVQSYTDGFSHLGGDPLTPVNTGVNKTFIENKAQGTGAGIIANGSVMIAARYLNINGVVQSGIPDWGVVIPEDVILIDRDNTANNISFVDAIANYEGKLAALGLGESLPDSSEYYDLFDATVTGLGDDVRQATVQFNAKEERLEVAGLEVKGGYIDLFGTIMNTGQNGTGQLKVLDGYGQIQVDNQTNWDLYLPSLDAGQGVEGKIKVTNLVDPDRDGVYEPNVTIYTRAGNGGSRIGDSVALDDSLRYIQAVGIDRSATSYYLYSKTALFGIDELELSSGTLGVFMFTTAANNPLLSGEYLGENTGKAAGFSTLLDQVASTDSPRYVVDSASESCNFLCITTTYTMLYHIVTGNKEIDNYIMGAGNDIDIEYIGYDNGLIDIKSNNDVYLRGSLYNRDGNTSVSSSTGSIFQLGENPSMSGNTITLNAADSIGTPDQSVQLNALNAADNIDLTASAITGDIFIDQLTGDMNISSIEALSGRVKLGTDSNMNTLGGSYIAGQRIDLASRNGSIGSLASMGTAGALLDVRTGVTADRSQNPNYGLSALARDDINIINSSGDLMVDIVESLSGNVRLETTGALIDNNDVERIDERGSEALEALWDTMQLGGAEAEIKAENQIALFENDVSADYRAYWNIRLGQADSSLYDPNFVVVMDATQEGVIREELMARNLADPENAIDINDFIAGYSTDKTAEYHARHERLYDPASENGVVGTVAITYINDFAYEADSTEQEKLIEGHSWTDRELAMGISRSFLKEITDTVPVIEEPNVKGNAIELVVANDIGTTNPVVVDLSKNPLLLTAAEKIAIAAAERGDLTLDKITNLLTIAQRDDVDLELLGDLTVNTLGSAYLGSETSVSVLQVQAANDVRLKVGGAITASQQAAANANIIGQNIIGQNIIVEASTGAIGADSAPLLVNVGDSSVLIARAQGDIYLEETEGDFAVDTLYSRGDITLSTEGSFVDAFDNDDLNIRARGISLSAGGSIGKDGNALDVLSSKPVEDDQGDIVDPGGVITAASGVGFDIVLNVPDSVGRFGAVDSGRDANLDAAFGLDITGPITALTDVILNAGNVVTVTSGGTVTTTIGDVQVLGSNLIMEDGGLIDAGTGRIIVDIDGDAVITGFITANTAAEAVSVRAGGSILDGGDGRVDVSATAASAAVIFEAGAGIGNLTRAADGTITQTPNALELDVALLKSAAAVEGIHLNSQFGLVAQSIVSDSGLVDLNVVGDTSAETITAGGNVVAVVLDGNLNIETAVSGAAFSVAVTNGDLALDTLDSGGEVNIGVEGGTATLGKVTAHNDIRVTTNGGHLSASALNSTAGNINTVTTQGDTELGAVSALGDVELVVDGGGLTANQVAAGANINLQTMGGGMTLDSAIAATDLRAEAEGGDISANSLTGAQVELVTLTNGAGVAVQEVMVGNALTLMSDNIELVEVLHTTDEEKLVVNISGNDGGLADTLSMKLTSNNVDYELVKSREVELRFTNDRVLFRDMEVGDYALITTPLHRIVIDNRVPVFFPDYTLQLAETRPFELQTTDSRLVFTNAKVVWYDPDYIVDLFSVHNSLTRLAASRSALMTSLARQSTGSGDSYEGDLKLGTEHAVEDSAAETLLLELDSDELVNDGVEDEISEYRNELNPLDEVSSLDIGLMH